MSESKVIGYYLDKDEKLEVKNIFVAIDEPWNKTDCDLTAYLPIGQHCGLSTGYLNGCTPISKEQYVAISKDLYTPQEYLEGRG